MITTIKDWILIESLGKWWPVDSDIPENITTLEPAYVDNFLYHVTTNDKRKQILHDGLIPSNSKKWQNCDDFVKYKNMLFATATADKSEWFEFYENMDVWKININVIKNIKWYEDPFTTNDWGVCTDKKIPVKALILYYDGKLKKYVDDNNNQ